LLLLDYSKHEADSHSATPRIMNCEKFTVERTTTVQYARIDLDQNTTNYSVIFLSFHTDDVDPGDDDCDKPYDEDEDNHHVRLRRRDGVYPPKETFAIYASVKSLIRYLCDGVEPEFLLTDASLKKLQSEMFDRDDLLMLDVLRQRYGLSGPELQHLPANLLFADMRIILRFLKVLVVTAKCSRTQFLYETMVDAYLALTPNKFLRFSHTAYSFSKSRVNDELVEANNENCAEEGEGPDEEGVVDGAEVNRASDNHIDDRDDEHNSTEAEKDATEEVADEEEEAEDELLAPKLDYLIQTYFSIADHYADLNLEQDEDFRSIGAAINQLKYMTSVVHSRRYNLFVHSYLLRLKIFVCQIDLARTLQQTDLAKCGSTAQFLHGRNCAILVNALNYMDQELHTVQSQLNREG
jgi:hypothetical protein